MNTDEVEVVDRDGNTVSTGDGVKIEGVTPIIIDLGKRSKKAIKNLKEGRGKLMAEVGDTVEQVRSTLGAQGKDVVPVILIYRQKARRISGAGGLLPFVPPPFNLLRS